MMKQIEIYGQRVALQSRQRAHLVEQSAIDRCLWTTQDDVALGVTKRFERMDEMQDPDPNNISELEIPLSFIGR